MITRTNSVDAIVTEFVTDAFENLTGRQARLEEWVTGPADEAARECVRAFAFENFLAIAGPSDA